MRRLGFVVLCLTLSFQYHSFARASPTTSTFLTGLKAQAMEFNASGELFVLNSDLTHTLYKVDSAGNATVVATGFSPPNIGNAPLGQYKSSSSRANDLDVTHRIVFEELCRYQKFAIMILGE